MENFGKVEKLVKNITSKLNLFSNLFENMFSLTYYLPNHLPRLFMTFPQLTREQALPKFSNDCIIVRTTIYEYKNTRFVLVSKINTNKSEIYIETKVSMQLQNYGFIV